MGEVNVERPLPAAELEQAVQAAGDVWEELKGRSVLITGATGFFGRWLIESLLSADRRLNLGVSVVALSRDPEAFLSRVPHLADRRIRWVKGSVSAVSPTTLGGQGLDAVIHLVTEGDMAASAADPRGTQNIIVEGTRHVLSAAKALGVRRLLFTSTGAAYGPQPEGMEAMPESYAGVPDAADKSNPYGEPGEMKRQAELLLEAEGHGLCAVTARCFTFAGPALPLRSKFAFGNFMEDALSGRRIVVKGDGTPIRSYLYGADLAVWLWTLLLRGAAGRRYNVGSEHPVSMRGLAEAVALELGAVGIEVLGEHTPGKVAERYVPSTKRAQEELSLREHFSLAEIIRLTAAWHRSNGKH
jgi:dTDP-glucose 4,6-dehydratase